MLLLSQLFYLLNKNDKCEKSSILIDGAINVMWNCDTREDNKREKEVPQT